MNRDEIYWKAVEERDASYDNKFYYGVITTGIYCNPSCKTRQALRCNVFFFESVEDAENFGLRACKKCNPGNKVLSIKEVVHTLCRYIETHVDKSISLDDISRKAGYSKSHIRREFIKNIGSTPKAYHQTLRQQKFKADLKTTKNVTDAIYEAGYSSPSRIYENITNNIGMTPKQYSKDGEQITIHYASGITSLGVTIIAATERGICFLQFGDDEQILLEKLQAEFSKAIIESMPQTMEKQFTEWIEALNNYLDKKHLLKSLPIDIKGTAFQVLVWRYLQTIPQGELRSYKEVAEAIGKPKAVRAVASACANNNIGIIIPCHRVLRGDGQLAGYRWGLERKRTLINLEKQKTHE